MLQWPNSFAVAMNSSHSFKKSISALIYDLISSVSSDVIVSFLKRKGNAFRKVQCKKALNENATGIVGA